MSESELVNAGSEVTTRKMPTIRAQREFWNFHWQHWQELKVINDWSVERAEKILHLLSSLHLTNPRILDLGCGIGWFTATLAKCGQVTGVDLSEHAISTAKARCPGVTFMVGNVLDGILDAQQFDIVISQEVLAHVEDQARYLEVASHCLRSCGYLILSTANRFVIERLGDSKWDSLPPEHIEQFLSANDLRRLLAPHFRVLHLTSVRPQGHRGLLRLVNSHKLNRAARIFTSQSRIDAFKEWMGLGYELVALAQKKS